MKLLVLVPLVFALDSTKHLTLIGVHASAVIYNGRRAVRLTDAGDSGGLALVDGVEFRSGTIELQVAATVAPGADTSIRGFVGIVFRSDSTGQRYENIYLRMTNGRADDQLRRNHSAQYAAIPDAPWYTLREESPGRYESYVDLEPGQWTTMRIVVHGTRAQLFVNHASQPCLIVNDLRHGDGSGRIGLMVADGTVAYFSRLVVTTE